MLIVDTGPLVAAADRSDRHHDQFREVIETDPGPFVTTAMVAAETAYPPSPPRAGVPTVRP